MPGNYVSTASISERYLKRLQNMCQHVPTTSKAFRGKNRCFAFPVGPGRLCWAQKFEILGRTDFGWFFHDDGLFWDGILDDVFLILDGFRMRISWR